jgi:hypothetical protein
MMQGRMSNAEEYERDLLQDPALVERILREFAAVGEGERVIIRTDLASVHAAIARALALAVAGIKAGIELIE